MTERPLEHLGRLVGTWTTAATHPASPGLIVRGTAIIEWLEGERFLILRSRNDHADFPDSISIIGVTDRDRVESAPTDDPHTTEARLSMHYFDSHGVFRVYEASVDDQAMRFWRGAPASRSGSRVRSPIAATPSPACGSCPPTTPPGTTTCRSRIGARGCARG